MLINSANKMLWKVNCHLDKLRRRSPVNWTSESTWDWLLRLKAWQAEVWNELLRAFQDFLFESLSNSTYHKLFFFRFLISNRIYPSRCLGLLRMPPDQRSLCAVFCHPLIYLDDKKFVLQTTIWRVNWQWLNFYWNVTLRNFQWALWEPEGESRAPWGPRYPWYLESEEFCASAAANLF